MGYSYVPFGSLESIVEQSKEGYYLSLRQTQSTIRSEKPNWQPWIAFFLRAMQQQKTPPRREGRTGKLSLAALPELAVKILDYARDQGRVTMGDAARATGASKNTLKEHFRNLVDKPHLAKHGGGRSTWYGLP
jgi:predicted HTH transcriptional regulator